MKSLYQYIAEGIKQNKDQIRQDIISSFQKFGDLYIHLRDEDNDEDCPEMHGESTYFVLKKTGGQRNILNICNNYYSYAMKLLQDNGWTVTSDVLTHPDEKPIKYRSTGQSYTSKPGPGSRGTTKNNAGSSFEMYLANSTVGPELVAKIAYAANRLSDSHSALHYESIEHVGGANTPTKQSLDGIRNANPSKHGGSNVADIIIKGEKDLPVSLKYTKSGSDVITLWNMGLYGGRCTYENMLTFINKFFNKENPGEYKDVIENTLSTFMPDGKQLSKQEWNELKKANAKTGSYIDINPRDIDENYIKDILRFAWGTDYYLVAGEGRNNQIAGFWVDSSSVESIISGSLVDVKLIIPQTTKMLGISFELNGIHYRIDMRDRAGSNKFTAGEVVFDKGLKLNDLMSIKIQSLQTYPPEITPELRKQIG